jgi:hypothetical protein
MNDAPTFMPKPSHSLLVGACFTQDELLADARTQHAEPVATQAAEQRNLGHPPSVTVHISRLVDQASQAKESGTVSICPVVMDDPSYVFLEDYRHRPYFVASNCLLQIGECPGLLRTHSTAHA